MNLRRQLLIASLLLLTLPWAGCQFVREMEGSMRQGQEQALQATAIAVAAALKDKPKLLYPFPQRLVEEASKNTGSNRSLYAYPVDREIILDGYDDGWEDIEFQQFESTSNDTPMTVRYKAATKAGRLFLFLQIEDRDVVFHNPALSREPNGDRLILRTWLDNRRQEYVIATPAPGKVRASYHEKIYIKGNASRIRGQWQDTTTGYNLELEIPLSLTGGRLGFFVINASNNSGGGFKTLGNASPLDMAPPPWLIYSPNALQLAVAPFQQHHRQLQIVDKTGWLLANASMLQSNAVEEVNTSGPGETFWLLRVLYRAILSRDTPLAPPPMPRAGKLESDEITAVMSGYPGNHWYSNPGNSSHSLLSSASPITDGKQLIGAVIIRQGSEEYLSLTDRAFSKLLGYSILAMGVGVFGLLAFASLLSWRIRKLSTAAANIVREDGSLGEDFPVSKARDEVGELSRRYAQMLEKLREHNDYLRTLSRKLSHELRTPIAVIQTSLENLEHQENTSKNSNTVYISRARAGLARLNSILTAMSEANRLEESIHGNSPREMNIIPLLREVFSAYKVLYKPHILKLECDSAEATVNVVPELIVQALDKLMDNAASFCNEKGRIILAVRREEEQLLLSVSNDGSTLPESLRNSLFDSMVSSRQGSSENVHLGLGLYIVRLIADFHGGSVQAHNKSDGGGVIFTITLPCKKPAGAS